MKNLRLLLMFSLVLLFNACSKDISQAENIIKKTELNLFTEQLIDVSSNISNFTPNIKVNNGVIKQIVVEEKAHEILAPLVMRARSLLKSYNLLDGLEESLNFDDKKILIAGILLMNQEKGMLNSDNSKKVNLIQSNMMDEIDSDELSGCLLEVFGLGSGVAGFMASAELMTVRGLTTLVAKVALKSLGWVGVAFMTYRFGKCLMIANTD